MSRKTDISCFTEYLQKVLDNHLNYDKLILKLIPAEIQNILNQIRPGSKYNYKVKGSVGYLKPAQIPWVAIMNTEITNSTQTGFYVVFLFDLQIKSINLCLGVGWNQFSKKYRSRELIQQKLEQNIQSIRKMVSLKQPGFEFKKLNLAATTELARGYEKSCFYYKPYLVSDLEQQDVLADLVYLMDICEELLDKGFNVIV